MKTRVEIAGQVALFAGRQAPEPRRALRAALRQLEREQGDIKVLEGPLREFHVALRSNPDTLRAKVDSACDQRWTLRSAALPRRPGA